MSGEASGSNLTFGEGSSRQNSSRIAVDDLKQRIKANESRGEFKTCLKLCREAIRNAPSDKDLLLMEAKFLVLTSQFDEANQILGKFIKENAKNSEAIFILGMIFYYRGNLRKSVEVFDNALQINATLSHVANLKTKANKLIKVFDEIGNKEISGEEKLQLIEAGMNIDASNKEVLKNFCNAKGILNYNLRKYRTAMENFTEALELDPENASLFMYRAKCFFNLYLFDDVIIDLLEVDRFDKNEEFNEEKQEMRREVGKLYITKTNYYFLEIPRTASDQEISQAFASLKLLHQVNISKAKTEADKRKLEFMFKRVENAFVILSDRKLKAKYDKNLSREDARVESAEHRRECWNGFTGGFNGCCSSSCEGCGNCCIKSFTFFLDNVKKIFQVLILILAVVGVFALGAYLWSQMGGYIFIPISVLVIILGCSMARS